MAFCPICKRFHDPDLNCFNGTTQLLRKIGIEGHKKLPKEELRKAVKEANRVLIALLIFILVIFLFGIWFHFLR